jgi:putative ABC transport system substrate-binding protein
MRRREVIAGFAAAMWPLRLQAQEIRRPPAVGVLWHAGNAKEEEYYIVVLERTFQDRGYIEGKNIILEHRFPAEQPDLFEKLAKELVESGVDLIIAVTARGATAVKRATSTLPIVFVAVADPVDAGLVDNLARPKGNATGLSLMTIDLSGKRLELLREAIGNLTRVGLLVDPTESLTRGVITATQAAGATLGISVTVQEAQAPEYIEQAFSAFSGGGAEAVIVAQSSMFFNERARIGTWAWAHKLPIFVLNAEMVPHGALMSYGQDFPEFFRRAAAYADKILKGAKPSDLPVEQPTRFKLVINDKVARLFGLTVPLSLLSRADEVIE